MKRKIIGEFGSWIREKEDFTFADVLNIDTTYNEISRDV